MSNKIFTFDASNFTKKFLYYLLIINIIALGFCLCVSYTNFLSNASDKQFRHNKLIKRLQQVIIDDLALINLFLQAKAGDRIQKLEFIELDSYTRRALKLYVVDHVAISSVGAAEDKSKIELSISFKKNLGKGAVFELKNIFLLNKIKKQVIAQLYINDFIEQLERYGDTGMRFFISHKESTYSGNRVKNNLLEHIIFNGENFIIKGVTDTDSFFNAMLKQNIFGWILLFAFMLIFNKIFLFRFRKEIKNVSQHIVELRKTILIAQEKENEHVTKQLTLCHCNQGLCQSIKVLSDENAKIFKELEEYMRYIESYFKMSEFMYSQEAMRELFAIFDQFDIEQLSDPSRADKVDMLLVIRHAIDLNFPYLQKKEVSLEKTVSGKTCVTIGHGSIYLRIVSSLLYDAIQASMRGAKIQLNLVFEKNCILVIILDWGYRICVSTEGEGKTGFEFFKMPIFKAQMLAQRYFLKLEDETISAKEGHMFTLRIPIKVQNNKACTNNVVYLYGHQKNF